MSFILNLPVVVVARVIASKKAKEAVRASSVKVAGRDVLATWKLLVALVFIPILYGFYAMIVLLVSFKYNWTTKWKILGPTLSFILMMVGSYATIRLVDTGFNIYKSLRPLFLSFFPGSRTKIKNLRAVREQLSQDLTELINELGPKIYEDFDAERIIQANRSQLSPNSNSNTSIFHSPIDWLDDQIFKWETVASSEYDDVFFFLDKQNGSVTGRSRTSSWAASGQSSRSRSRTSSFGAGPSGGESFRVEAMTELPRDKPFSELTRTSSIPRLEVKDTDEELGYQGDREDEESKKTV